MKYDLQHALLLLAWALGVIYSTIPLFWLLVHPFADFWRRRKSPFTILLPLWILLWIALGALSWPWHMTQLYSASNSCSWILGMLIFVAAIFVYERIPSSFDAHKLLGLAELQPNLYQQKLVTTGIYARVRHPIYMAHVCMLLAWSVGSGLLVNYYALLSVLFTGATMVALEEQELARRFGDVFIQYKARVPAFWPRQLEIRKRIAVRGETVTWEFIMNGEKKNSWEFPSDQLVCLGEYTTAAGPLADDYFFVFVTRDAYCYETSFYAEGRDALLAELGKKLGAPLECRLCNSTQWASRIIWPPFLANQEFYEEDGEKIRINPRVLELTESSHKA